MDDLYNNLMVYEPEVKGMSSSSSSTLNMAFASSSNNNTSSSNEAVNVAHGVTTASKLKKRLDLRWQMAMLTMRARRFLNNTQKEAFWSVELQEIKQQETRTAQRWSVACETSTSIAFGEHVWSCAYALSDQAEEGPNYALMANSSSSSDSEVSNDSNCFKIFSISLLEISRAPPTLDLSFTGLDEFVNKPVVENRKSDEEVSKVVRKNDDAPIIEEWVSDSEEENVSQTKTEKKTVKPSIAKIEFVKPKQQEKTVRKIVKQVEQHRQNTYSPRGNQRNWNNMMSQKLGSNFEMFNKACYVCGSFDHLQVDCNYHQKQFQNQRMVKPVWNNAQRVNHQNFAKKTHPCAKKNLVPRAVLMKSSLVLVNTARQVNTAHSKTTVNAARPMSYLSKTAHLTVKRPIHKNTTFKNSNIDQRVNTAQLVWVWKPKTKVLDHVSKHNSASITLKKFDYIDAQGNPSQDNGTEFKNKEMNQFCEMNGILRQFSIARTPQQNGVAERRNRTLIEAVRTMLADSKLPTTFWVEAVNTACYVQNRMLVVKPHNKDLNPYELFLGFEDPDFPDRVYKVEKALYGLHQAPRAWHKGDILLVKQKKDDIFISQDKYVVEILKKFKFTEVKTASTPMETQKPLIKDEDGEKAYTDSDYAGASLDRKSTTGGCQFLRCRLISWQCKKQTMVANSTTEAEYVAASSCYGQVFLDSESTT
ncbi:ribonuclease H-like domain-containing protein [Tanacetum coccineum]